MRTARSTARSRIPLLLERLDQLTAVAAVPVALAYPSSDHPMTVSIRE